MAMNMSTTIYTPRVRMDAIYEYLTRRTGHLATIHESETVGFIGVDSDDIPDLMMYHKFFKKGFFKVIFLTS